MKKLNKNILMHVSICLIVTLYLSFVYSLESLPMGMVEHFILSSVGIFIIGIGVIAVIVEGYLTLSDEVLSWLLIFPAICNYYLFIALQKWLERKKLIILSYILTSFFLLINLIVGFLVFL